jgi:hypothetical protein
MFKSNLLGLGVMALFFSTATVACSGANPRSDGSTSEDVTGTQNFYACETDSDCVAVPKVGCCSNGWMEAVNKHEVNAYENSFVCNEQIMCPMYVVDDTRVPACVADKCQMVDADAGAPDAAGPDAGEDADDGGSAHVTCMTLECASGYHCCSGPLTANGPLGDAYCQANGSFCPL